MTTNPNSHYAGQPAAQVNPAPKDSGPVLSPGFLVALCVGFLGLLFFSLYSQGDLPSPSNLITTDKRVVAKFLDHAIAGQKTEALELAELVEGSERLGGANKRFTGIILGYSVHDYEITQSKGGAVTARVKFMGYENKEVWNTYKFLVNNNKRIYAIQ